MTQLVFVASQHLDAVMLKHKLANRLVILSCYALSFLLVVIAAASGLFDQIINIAVGAGEYYKRLACFTSLIRILTETKQTKQTTIISCGGGVIGDLAGFIASSYMRGVCFTQLPSTLLAQTDSAIGGKTGLNTRIGKNTLGAFYMPDYTYINIDLLKTLPQHEWTAGLSEIIKISFSLDLKFFIWLHNNNSAVYNRVSTYVYSLVCRAGIIKSIVTKLDPYDFGLRAALNFGHSFGHALEAVLNYSKWPHGHAVSCGMHVAMVVARAVLVATEQNHRTLAKTLKSWNLPLITPCCCRAERVMQLVKYDKKIWTNRLMFVLARFVGDSTFMMLTQQLTYSVTEHIWHLL